MVKYGNEENEISGKNDKLNLNTLKLLNWNSSK